MLKSGDKKTIVNISSDAASLTHMSNLGNASDPEDSGQALSYKASKVALNMGKWSSHQRDESHTNTPVHSRICILCAHSLSNLKAYFSAQLCKLRMTYSFLQLQALLISALFMALSLLLSMTCQWNMRPQYYVRL